MPTTQDGKKMDQKKPVSTEDAIFYVKPIFLYTITYSMYDKQLINLNTYNRGKKDTPATKEL
jgi:hypothetical protein